MSAGNSGVNGQRDDLYAQAMAARQQSQFLAGQLRATQRKNQESWQLIQAAWDRTQQIRTLRRAPGTDPDRLRYSAYARLQAKLASMPVIEQAKGVIMAQCGWPEDRAFEALRQASQRENIKVRDLAAMIVARAASSVPARRPAGQAPPSTLSRGESSSSTDSSGFRDRYPASA
jgi:hypothetical protein